MIEQCCPYATDACRGTGKSEGHWEPNINERPDGRDTLQWLNDQPCNLDTDDLKQAGNLGLWKAVPKFDAARGMKFLTYAAPAIRNAMMDMVRDAFTAFEQRMVTEDKDGICYQRVSLDDVLPGEEQLRRIEAIADPYAMQLQSIVVV